MLEAIPNKVLHPLFFCIDGFYPIPARTTFPSFIIATAIPGTLMQ
jgi:hypothetical protein